jgi:hypothetical protein
LPDEEELHALKTFLRKRVDRSNLRLQILIFPNSIIFLRDFVKGSTSSRGEKESDRFEDVATSQDMKESSKGFEWSKVSC